MLPVCTESYQCVCVCVNVCSVCCVCVLVGVQIFMTEGFGCSRILHFMCPVFMCTVCDTCVTFVSLSL